MSVSASAVNGSFGCLVLVVVWFSRFFTWFPWFLRFLWISQGSRFFCGFRGYLGYPLLGHVLFCESCGLFLELLWFSRYLWSSWFFSSSHGQLVLRFSWFQCFSWLSWMPWSVLCFLWSESSFCSTRPRCSLCYDGLQGSYISRGSSVILRDRLW